MDAKRSEVQQWLESIYGSASAVPCYEKSSASINLLHQLMTVSKEADKQAQILNQDYLIRADEYTAKSEQIASAMRCVGLSISSLTDDARCALTELSQAATVVNAAVPSESQIMLGSVQLESQHDEICRQASESDELRSQLSTLSQQLATKIQHAKMLKNQVEVALELEKKDEENDERRALFHEKKLMEYEKDISEGEALLKHRGYTGSITHDSVVQQWQELQQLQKQVTTLRSQLESYSLPPDVSAVRLEVERCRQHLASLVADMAQQQTQGFT
ncbi:uncharacterized protein LOC108669042 [Hyalella azteca]|uniref:Uncharacterized protein LOC108669042 n=1 Tax=Hyalella azteca TaxID=294128 RepID=A0A8B7NEA8_HYAAZ|nr:uncharacterized protein LOC108669042 [Hyalella azteca]